MREGGGEGREDTEDRGDKERSGGDGVRGRKETEAEEGRDEG